MLVMLCLFLHHSRAPLDYSMPQTSKLSLLWLSCKNLQLDHIPFFLVWPISPFLAKIFLKTNISTSHGLLGPASMPSLTKSSINHHDTGLMQCRHACKPQQPMRLALSSDFLHKNRSRALITSSQCSLPWLSWPDWFAIYIVHFPKYPMMLIISL